MAKEKKPKKAKPAAAPVTTAQRLGALIKSARNIMRKDRGLNGDLDRLPMLTWLMFLKFLDDHEQAAETDAKLAKRAYRATLDPPYRWRDWALKDSFASETLVRFLTLEQTLRPDGSEGLGLIPYLRTLADSADPKRQVVGRVFAGVLNRMESGTLFWDLVDKVNGIHFDSSDEIHTLGHLYESLLREMRDAAGDSGEFYTPRAVVKFAVAALDPRLGETVLDPACGTGGFLVEAFAHLKGQAHKAEEVTTLQTRSVFGQEAKPLPYMLCQMNLLLHGLDAPQIAKGNSLAVKLSELGDADRVDVILTNPPFGGEEEKGVQNGFPDDKQTAETALLFLQLIMRKLRRPAKGTPGGRAAVVVPNGTLFGDGVCARIKAELLTNFNLHTVVRLPNGVFSPYTSIPTNVLFFDRSGPTGDIWYYEVPPPDGRKQYTKTAPMPFEAFVDCLSWWKERSEGERAWKVPFAAEHAAAREKAEPHWTAVAAADARAAACKATGDADGERREREVARSERGQGDALYLPVFNLDRKNPRAKADAEHLPPEQLVESILAKEAQIAALVGEIKALLAGGVA